MPRESEVFLRRSTRSLLESVQDVDGLREPRHVKDAMLGACVDPDLLHSESDTRQRFPLVRVQSALDSPQLESPNLPGVAGKTPHLFSGAPEPHHRLASHDTIYKNLNTRSTAPPGLTSVPAASPNTTAPAATPSPGSSRLPSICPASRSSPPAARRAPSPRDVRLSLVVSGRWSCAASTVGGRSPRCAASPWAVTA